MVFPIPLVNSQPVHLPVDSYIHVTPPGQMCIQGLSISTECSATYASQTGRSVKHRVKEHKYALKTRYTNVSALAEHNPILSIGKA